MPVQQTCPNGHQWAIGGDARGVVSCPVCGAESRAEAGGGVAAADGQYGLETLRPTNQRETPTLVPPSPPIDATPRTADESRPSQSFALPQVSGYELLSVLGRGGMGIVYRARQIALKREVALKMVLGAEHGPSEHLDRFRTEAESVARLQHANIVQIFEVGQSEGRPFLALELVSGGNLAAKLNGEPQPPREAAALVSTLAKAIEFAHRQKILHRDLKPANILLAADGSPKISDFGLAKQLESPSANTMTGDVMGTPNYMAPEQASGVTRRLGPGCDLYSLGVILYEALTGRPPIVGADPVDTLLRVISDDPVPPRRLLPKIPRDLETICLKCLEKSPGRRYAAAQDLADDLDRWLDGRPIAARPAGPIERFGKWARRRPAAALALGVLIATPLAAMAGLAWHSQRLHVELQNTQREFNRAETDLTHAQDTIDALLDEIGDERVTSNPETQALRRALLDQSLRFCEGLLEQNPTHIGVRWRTARAQRQVGSILASLGREGEAERQFVQALATLDHLVQEDPEQLDYRYELAAAHNNFGNVLVAMERADDAVTQYRAAERLFAETAAERPEDLRWLRQLAIARNNLGTAYADLGNLQESVRNHALALESRKAAVTAEPANATAVADLATSHNNLGAVLRDEARAALAEGSEQAAAEALGRAAEELDAARELLAGIDGDDARLPAVRLASATALNNLAAVQMAQRRTDEAIALYDQARATMKSLWDDYPLVHEFRGKFAAASNNLAMSLAALGRTEEALGAFEDAGAAYSAGLESGRNAVEDRRGRAIALVGAASIERFDPEQMAAAEEKLEQALELRSALAADYPQSGDYWNELATTQLEAGELLLSRNDARVAREYLMRAVESGRRALNVDPGNPSFQYMLGEELTSLATALVQLGEPALAAQAADEAASLAKGDADRFRRAADLLGECFSLAQSVKSADFDADAWAEKAVRLVAEAAASGAVDAQTLDGSKLSTALSDREAYQQLLERLPAQPKTDAVP